MIFSRIDALVRASALSNLGEVCQNLRFSIGGMAHEVREAAKGTTLLSPKLLFQMHFSIHAYLVKISRRCVFPKPHQHSLLIQLVVQHI